MKKIHISHNDMLYVVFIDVTTSEFTGHVAHCNVVSDILWLYLIKEYTQECSEMLSPKVVAI